MQADWVTKRMWLGAVSAAAFRPVPNAEAQHGCSLPAERHRLYSRKKGSVSGTCIIIINPMLDAQYHGINYPDLPSLPLH